MELFIGWVYIHGLYMLYTLIRFIQSITTRGLENWNAEEKYFSMFQPSTTRKVLEIKQQWKTRHWIQSEVYIAVHPWWLERGRKKILLYVSTLNASEGVGNGTTMNNSTLNSIQKCTSQHIQSTTVDIHTVCSIAIEYLESVMKTLYVRKNKQYNSYPNTHT